MKQIPLYLSLFIAFAAKGQADSISMKDKVQRKAHIITRFSTAYATKDGYYLEGFVVNISSEKAKRLDGHIIQVSGKITIVPGIGNQPRTKNMQGRKNDTKHILSPKIIVVE